MDASCRSIVSIPRSPVLADPAPCVYVPAFFDGARLGRSSRCRVLSVSSVVIFYALIS